MDDLKELIKEMREKMQRWDLPDEYLSEHNLSTRDEVGIGEYSYGITMIPCKWVVKYLEELKELKSKFNEKEGEK